MKFKSRKFNKRRELSRTNLKRKCDSLFSLKVREVGYCQLKGMDRVSCGGVLQCAHIETRGRRSIRWHFENAVCICAGHHVYYTNNPNAWDELIARLFPQKWAFVQAHKEELWDKDYFKVLERLTNL